MLKYTEPILNEREGTHGDYTNTATLAQCLKATIRNKVAVDLTKVQRESLDMICTKIARICSGNPNNKDHWDDIAGYAKLASENLGRTAPSDATIIAQAELETQVIREKLKERKHVVGEGKRGDISFTGTRFNYGVTEISDGPEKVPFT